MLMMKKERSYTCLLILGVVSVGPQLFTSHSLREDHRPLARALYKLDPSWPRKPELFAGDVFAVAVNHNAGVLYVAQRGKHHHKLMICIVLLQNNGHAAVSLVKFGHFLFWFC